MALLATNKHYNKSYLLGNIEVRMTNLILKPKHNFGLTNLERYSIHILIAFGVGGGVTVHKVGLAPLIFHVRVLQVSLSQVSDFIWDWKCSVLVLRFTLGQ